MSAVPALLLLVVVLLALPSAPDAGAAADHQHAQQQSQSHTTSIGTVAGDVRLYGAEPASGNDDTAALRRALANCSQTNGQVFIPAGTYTVSHPVPVGWHPQMGEVLNQQSVPILPVPSHCTVFGEGNTSVVNLADSVNRAAFFRMFGTCSAHADGCGLCSNSTAGHSTPSGGIVPAKDCNGQMGPSGPPGHNWPDCNFTCPSAPSVTNITFRDLYLWGSTSYKCYSGCSTPTSGFREHGAAIYFYQANTSQPPITSITVQRVTAGGFAGDAMDFGGGVQDLLVEDCYIKDYTRQGVDFAGQSGYGDETSRNFTARRVRDLPFTLGFEAGGSTIHVEEAGGLMDVFIEENYCNHSILASGPTNMVISGNTVTGQILGDGDKATIIKDNLVISRTAADCDQQPPMFGAESGQSTALIAVGFSTGVLVSNNTLRHHSNCAPVWKGQLGIELLGGFGRYPMVTNTWITGNHFEFDHADANSTLIGLSGCNGVVVESNDFGSVAGTDADHTKVSRCTSCLIEGGDTPKPKPSPSPAPPPPSPPPAPPPPPPPPPPRPPAPHPPIVPPFPPSPPPPPPPKCTGVHTVTAFGAVANDGQDDTAAIQAALNACTHLGGAVCVPAGTYTISMPEPDKQLTTDICLAVPSDCTIYGEGATSILKFAAEVNTQGWWRMLGPALLPRQTSRNRSKVPPGPPNGSAHNITIRDLHLHGSTNHTHYPCFSSDGKQKLCDHNTLIMFYTLPPGTVRDVTVQRIVAEAIAGDIMSFAYGVQNLLVEDIQIRDFLRQGVDLAGDNLTFNHTVRRVTELDPWLIVPFPGGSTLHIEEAGDLTHEGLHDVELYDCIANHSILASGVHNLTIRDNLIYGQLIGDLDTELTVEGNTIVATTNGTMMQMLAPQGMEIKGNTLVHADDALQVGGVYVWGHDENYPSATDILIAGNDFVGSFTEQGKAIHLYGVDGVVVSGNHFDQTTNGASAINNTCKCCRIPPGPKAVTMCANVTVRGL